MAVDLMLQDLNSNISGFESYLPGSEVSDPQSHINEHIPHALHYACYFWDDHLKHPSLYPDPEMAGKDEKTNELALAIESRVGNIYPILAGVCLMSYFRRCRFLIQELPVAIYAFSTVPPMDLIRRLKNRMLIAVKLQMQNMMFTMFQYVTFDLTN